MRIVFTAFSTRSRLALGKGGSSDSCAGSGEHRAAEEGDQGGRALGSCDRRAAAEAALSLPKGGVTALAS
jgi:hypothetical protein